MAKRIFVAFADVHAKDRLALLDRALDLEPGSDASPAPSGPSIA
jgi:hypothetical protein